MRWVVLGLALVASPAVAQQEGPFPQTCTYSDTSAPPEDGADEVLCSMRYVSTATGLRYTFRFGGRTVVVDQSLDAGNGLWSAGRIDGKPAVILELWRGSRVAVTTDTSVSLEWRDRGAPKYPAN